MGYVKGILLGIALLFFGLVAFLVSFVVMLTGPLTARLRPYLNLIFLLPFGWFARTVVGVKLTILNRERLFLHRPMIFFGNHQSGLDLAVIGMTCTPGTVIVGKKEIQNIPLFGWYWKTAGNLLINRSKPAEAKAQIDEVRSQLSLKNLNLAIFPEGTRSKNGDILPFKKGIFYLAASTGFPLIPIVCSRMKGKAIWETFDLAGGNIVVSVLEAIDTQNLKAENIDTFRESVRNKMVLEYERVNALAESYDRDPKSKKPGSCC